MVRVGTVIPSRLSVVLLLLLLKSADGDLRDRLLFSGVFEPLSLTALSCVVAEGKLSVSRSLCDSFRGRLVSPPVDSFLGDESCERLCDEGEVQGVLLVDVRCEEGAVEEDMPCREERGKAGDQDQCLLASLARRLEGELE